MKDSAVVERIAEMSGTAEQIRSLLSRVWEGYRHDPAQAVLDADEARRIAQHHGDRSARIESLAALSLSQEQAGDFERSLSAAQEAVRLLDGEAGKIPVRVQMQAFYSLGTAQVMAAQYDEAHAHFEKALLLVVEARV